MVHAIILVSVLNIIAHVTIMDFVAIDILLSSSKDINFAIKYNTLTIQKDFFMTDFSLEQMKM